MATRGWGAPECQPDAFRRRRDEFAGGLRSVTEDSSRLFYNAAIRMGCKLRITSSLHCRGPLAAFKLEGCGTGGRRGWPPCSFASTGQGWRE